MVNMVNTGPRIVCLLTFILFSAGHVFSAEDTVYAQTGKSYTFKPKITGPCESILWKLNNDKVVEFEDGVLKWFQFNDQGDLNTKTGDLTLFGLKKSQNGLYESEIQVAGKLQYSKHNLQVINPVSAPKVTCEDAPDGKMTFLCTEPNSEPAEFTWSGPDSLTHKGVTLTISKETKWESVYFCTVKNKLNEESQQFTLQECYAAAADGVSPALIAGVVVPLIVIVVIVVIVVFREKIQQYLPVSNN